MKSCRQPPDGYAMPKLGPVNRTTIKDVRYYTTKPMNGGTMFKCTLCEHSVTTLDFNMMNGNRRTQAAAMINQHAAAFHLPASLRVKLGSRGAL